MPLFIGGIGVWICVSLLAVFDAQIKGLLCPLTSLACRSSNRPDTWAAALQLIVQQPLLGVGYRFRFPGDVPHAHNAYLGLALHFGIPVLAAFVWYLAASAREIGRMANADEQSFAATLYIFASGFMGTDLSDPSRFLNSHYLFLWMPLFLAAVARKRGRDAVPDSGLHEAAAQKRQCLTAR